MVIRRKPAPMPTPVKELPIAETPTNIDDDLNIDDDFEEQYLDEPDLPIEERRAILSVIKQAKYIILTLDNNNARVMLGDDIRRSIIKCLELHYVE